MKIRTLIVTTFALAVISVAQTPVAQAQQGTPLYVSNVPVGEEFRLRIIAPLRPGDVPTLWDGRLSPQNDVGNGYYGVTIPLVLLREDTSVVCLTLDAGSSHYFVNRSTVRTENDLTGCVDAHDLQAFNGGWLVSPVWRTR